MTDEKTEFNRHKFWLRKDCEVWIDLPTDLTLNEADRLSAFMLTLSEEPTKDD